MELFNRMKKLYVEDLGESVSVILPHEDDIPGCTGIVRAAYENGALVYVIVMTGGDLGYTDVKQKDSIVKTRERDAEKAYKLLGIGDAVFLGFPDMDLDSYKRDASLRLVEELRRIKPKTSFIPGPEEHIDHEATYKISRHVIFTQVGYPNLPDLGEPAEVENVFEYGVWSRLDKPTHYFKLPKVCQETKKELLRVFGTQTEVLEKLGLDFKKEKFRKLK